MLSILWKQGRKTDTFIPYLLWRYISVDPGRLPYGLTVEMLRGHHKSIPANPLLARPMYLYGSIEQVGTGTEMIVNQCISKGLKKPLFVQDVDFSVILYRPDSEVNDQVATQVDTQVDTQVKKLLLKFTNEDMKTEEIQKVLGLRERRTFFRNYVQPALKLGLIERTIPEKPNSRLQKYRLTPKGWKLKDLFLENL